MLRYSASRAGVLATILAMTAVVPAATTPASTVASPAATGPAAQVRGPAPAPVLLSASPVLPTLPAARETSAAPPTTALCLSVLGIPCYGATQLEHAYGADTAHRLGLTGAGSTIAVLEAYGDPAAQADLDAYDAGYGLPDTAVQVLKFGAVPAVPTTDDEKTWASETALDLEAAHTMAPGARLVLIETGTDETTGTTGLPQMMDALSAVVARERIDVVDLSFAVAEQNFPDQSGTAGDYGLLYGLRYGLRAAAERGVSLLASTGDWGATGPALDGTDTYPFPTVSWPSSDPLVTAVGGTTLYPDAAGDRTSPDTAWTDLPAGNGAGGGGLSAAFARPPYQNGVSAVVGARRGLPDISMNASCRSLMLTYSTYRVTGQAGWNVVCGTSEASPLLAGLVADAAGLAHRPLGDIDGALYRLTARPAGASAAGIADVTAGCNTDLGVTGYCAGLGYDPVTGIGTVEDATRFILALAFEATHGSPR